tara:strand:- start:17518 stop:17787 length:270 start_codon:yes stop_codon:yes gene_type:complete
MKKAVKTQVGRRLKIISGQIAGLQKKVENEEYCIDIITQTSAVRQALSAIEDLMLENHLTTHVTEQIQAGQQKKAVDEILSVYKLSKKK